MNNLEFRVFDLKEHKFKETKQESNFDIDF